MKSYTDVNKIFIYILIFIPAVSIFSQSNTKNYSLQELVNIAFQNNPQLKANDKNILAGMKQIDYLAKDYQPQLFFDFNISRWKYLLPNKQRLLGNSLTDIYADFRINQLIYDWEKNSIQKEYAEKSVDIERNFDKKIRLAISYSITRNYLELLRAKRVVQIQEEAINQLQEHLKNAEALYSIGKVSNLDVIKAQIQIEVAIDELAKAKNQLNVQKNNLNVLCGNTLSDSFDVTDNSDEWWKVSSSKVYDFNDLQKQLSEQHPDLENVRVQKELRTKEIQLYNKEYYPNFYAFGITNVEDGKIPMGNFNWNFGVTVSYSLPFFRGSNFKDKVEQTQIRIDALQENENSILQQIEANVKNSLVKLEDTKSRLSGTEKIVKLAEESLVTANLKYNIGKGSSLDVLDAETVITTAKLNYNQIIIDFLSAIAELNYNVGKDEISFH